MATKDFQELKNRASGNDQTAPTVQHNEQINPTENLLKEGAEYGFGFGYSLFLEGFVYGCNQGSLNAKEKVKNFLKNREPVKITIDINSACDNFPKIESKPIFSLGGGNVS